MVENIDEVRTAIQDMIRSLPLKESGLILLDVGRAFLEKQNNYSPRGSLLMRLATHDEKLTICLARDDAAPLLSIAHDALKQHLGCD